MSCVCSPPAEQELSPGQSAPKALVRHKEEAQEFGGYFIVNGNERIVRMLIMPRRNYVSRTPMDA